MANIKRTYKALRSQSASDVPGDTLRIATYPIVCSDYTILPVGTTFRPLAGGMDDNRRYSDISIISAP